MRRAVPCALAAWLALAGIPSSVSGPESGAGRCWITGEVVQEGRPVAARVEATLRLENPRFPHGFYWTAESSERYLVPPPREVETDQAVEADAEGRFRLEGLSSGRYRVSASVGDAWAAHYVPLHVEGQHAEVHLDLRPARERLEGRLVHADGRPFRGLAVATMQRPIPPDDLDAQAFEERVAETDGEGRFLIQGLPTGRVWLTALDPGRFRRTADPVDLPWDGPFEFVVDKVRDRIEGRVLDIDTDAPIPGARVVWSAGWDANGPHHGVVVTDSQGKYSIPERSLDHVHVRHEGYAERHWNSLKGIGRGDQRLRRGTTVTGRVVRSDTREPLAELVVERRGPGSYWYQWTRAVSDAEGRFALSDQAPGSGRIYARGLGWIPASLGRDRPFVTFEALPVADPLAWHVDAGRSLDAVLEVRAGVALEGRVVDASGAPAAGVPISISSSDDPEYSWTGQYLPPLVATGADGRFRLEGLLPREEYEIRASPSAGAPLVVKLHAEASGAPTDPVDLRLPPARWLLVSVVDAKTRAPIPGARVDMREEPRDWSTGPDGVARVGPLGREAGELDVSADGFITANQLRAPLPTAEGTAVVVALAPALTIEGTVLDEAGAPASGAVVYTSEKSDDMWKHYRGLDRCRPDGSFTADNVNDIDYEVKAVLWRDGGRFEAVATVHGGARGVVLKLARAPEAEAGPESFDGPAEERPPAVVVRIVDPEGRPVPRVTLLLGGGTVDVVGGVLERANPLPADQPIEAWGATADDGVPLPLGPLVLSAPPRTEGEITLTLPPGHVIAGRVMDVEHRPVARAVVRAIPARRWTTPPPERDEFQSAVTDAEGRFRFRGLGPEEYVLQWLLLPGWHPPAVEVRAAGGTQDLEIVLHRGVNATVAVKAPDGTPVADARVEALRPGWTYFWRYGWRREDVTAAVAITDREGRVVLPGLDSRRPHTLVVKPPEGRLDLSKTKIESWTPADREVALGPNTRVRARIVDASGAPVDADFLLWRQDGPWRRAYDQAEKGLFSTDVAAAGDLQVAAGVGVMGEPLPGAVIVTTRTGDEPVRLVLDAGAELVIAPVEGLPPDTVLLAVRPEGGGPGWSHHGLRSKGPTTLRGLDPARSYVFWVVGVPGGLCARQTVRGDQGNVALTLTSGQRIEGRVRVEGSHSAVTVGAKPVGGGPYVEVESADGTFALDGLTEGRWVVRARTVVGDEDVEASAEVDAGSRVDLALPPR